MAQQWEREVSAKRRSHWCGLLDEIFFAMGGIGFSWLSTRSAQRSKLGQLRIPGNPEKAKTIIIIMFYAQRFI